MASAELGLGSTNSGLESPHTFPGLDPNFPRLDDFGLNSTSFERCSVKFGRGLDRVSPGIGQIGFGFERIRPRFGRFRAKYKRRWAKSHQSWQIRRDLKPPGFARSSIVLEAELAHFGPTSTRCRQMLNGPGRTWAKVHTDPAYLLATSTDSGPMLGFKLFAVLGPQKQPVLNADMRTCTCNQSAHRA